VALVDDSATVKRFYKEEGKPLASFGIDEGEIEAGQPLQRIGPYTVMSFDIEKPRCRWMAVLTESGATSAVSSTWFYLVLLLNGLWLIMIVGIGIYMFIRVFNPLKRISANVPDESVDGDADDMDKISRALERYHEQLSSSQTTIDSQEELLRRACLQQMALEQPPLITQEQLERLGIPQLLLRYILITLYPDDGYWTLEQYSVQENDYRRHVTVTAVQQLIRAQMQESMDMQFVVLQSCLLMIVPVGEDASERNIRQTVESALTGIGAQMGKRFRFGISRVRTGEESFSRAYHEAMLHAALLEEKEGGRSEDISLNMLLKQNMHMADLVYMERYNSAFACFKEMVETLFKQKSRHLRNRQLSSLLSLTLCMLTETNKTNVLLLEQMNIDTNELLNPEDEEKLLLKWEKVFSQLEENKNQRIHGQYSEQFAPIYQYMHAHFRDQELSLSLLAEKYGMSVSTLSREFQKNLGQGFLECLHQMRIDAARYEIEHTNAPLSEIAVAVGYTNTLTMTRTFKKYLGCTPSTFRKKDAAP
ncbi:MAG: helix-turn-helix domain-containing protein, partial [Clostridia bacterium]|nr:helix-turn-helix domain-containing protein [Clostridia bacterium]